MARYIIRASTSVASELSASTSVCVSNWKRSLEFEERALEIAIRHGRDADREEQARGDYREPGDKHLRD